MGHQEVKRWRRRRTRQASKQINKARKTHNKRPGHGVARCPCWLCWAGQSQGRAFERVQSLGCCQVARCWWPVRSLQSWWASEASWLWSAAGPDTTLQTLRWACDNTVQHAGHSGSGRWSPGTSWWALSCHTQQSHLPTQADCCGSGLPAPA